MAINSVALAGNLTRDAQLKAMQSGKSILEFSIAVNERRRQEDGTWKDEPSYFDCVVFGSRAEPLSAYLVKGTKVSIVGRLHQSRFEAKDGSKRSKVEVHVDEIEFMSKRDTVTEAPEQPAPKPAAPRRQAPQPAQQPAPQDDVYDEDIPF